MEGHENVIVTAITSTVASTVGSAVLYVLATRRARQKAELAAEAARQKMLLETEASKQKALIEIGAKQSVGEIDAEKIYITEIQGVVNFLKQEIVKLNERLRQCDEKEISLRVHIDRLWEENTKLKQEIVRLREKIRKHNDSIDDESL